MFKLIALLCSFVLMAEHLSAAKVDFAPCLTFNWAACGISVGTGLYQNYYGKWQDSQDVQAFGTTCKTQFRGSFYRWKWVWGGQFWCPSISASIKGDSSNWQSRTGCIEHALQDFVTKAGQAGALTQEQISQVNKS